MVTRKHFCTCPFEKKRLVTPQISHVDDILIFFENISDSTLEKSLQWRADGNYTKVRNKNN